MRIIDKDFCASSYLCFRYIIDDNADFYEDTHHSIYHLIPEDKHIGVTSAKEIDRGLEHQFRALADKKLGILLSGGMDSGCLASYMNGCDAYTFRFLGGSYQKDELSRAERFAEENSMRLHYVDITWDTVISNLNDVMRVKGAPVHSIEPQIVQASKQAKEDGIDLMIIGDAADYVFGGMDGLHAKDWTFEEFKKRYIYLDPSDVLVNPVSMDYAFEKYRRDNKIDFIGLMHEYTDIESYSSYDNAFKTAGLDYLDPYEIFVMKEPLDLFRVRHGESKYLIRELFKLRYPDIPVPEKLPMPRPVDEYFKNWKGPSRPEFRKELDINRFSGNQKWLLYCLEKFFDLYEF